MKNKLIVLSGMALGFVAPVVVFAQNTFQTGGTGCEVNDSGSVGNIQEVICRVMSILNSLIPLIVTLGIIYFVWGVVSYVIASDAEAKKKGRDRIIFGIIGLAVIISVWGLVVLLRDTFFGNSDPNVQDIVFPTVPGGNN